MVKNIWGSAEDWVQLPTPMFGCSQMFVTPASCVVKLTFLGSIGTYVNACIQAHRLKEIFKNVSVH